MSRYFIPLFLLASILILPFCTTAKKAAGTGKDQPKVSYTADVAPILQNRCTPCHFPETGRKKLLNTHAAVSSTIDDILMRVQLPHDDPKFMPFKSKSEPLSDSLIMVLKLWKETGMAE